VTNILWNCWVLHKQDVTLYTTASLVLYKYCKLKKNICILYFLYEFLIKDLFHTYPRVVWRPLAHTGPVPSSTVQGATGLINIWQHWDTRPDNPGLPRHRPEIAYPRYHQSVYRFHTRHKRSGLATRR
jgi:hypothetical protein